MGIGGRGRNGVREGRKRELQGEGGWKSVFLWIMGSQNTKISFFSTVDYV